MYYRLEGNSATMTTYAEAIKRTSKSLIRGSEIKEKEGKLPYQYTYHDPAGNQLIDFFGGPKIMSKKMYQVFIDCGVDNIQALPLQFINKETNEIRDDYIVFNVIGLISCARMEESDSLPLGGGFFFRNLLIDPTKTNGLLAFRLKESSMEVIVHESVAKKLEENNIQGIILTPATEKN